MENKLNETLIDLSVDIYQKCPTLPNHPPMVLSDYQTHKTIREAEGVKFSCASMYMSMCSSIGRSVCLSIYLFMCLFICLSIDLWRACVRACMRACSPWDA